jgi:Fe-S-cluster containining protein
MPPPSAPPAALARLEAAAKQWEREVVIPHCAVCTRPCCALTDVVLDLSAAEAETLYRIMPSSPKLPSTVQASGGRFYAHGAPCPAFATSTQRCTIYDTGRKPKGCADFPVYADDDVVTADTRCEAVAANVAGLEDALFQALAPGETLAVLRDDGDDDGVFVSFQVEGPPAPKTTAPASKATAPAPTRQPQRKPQTQGKPEPREKPPALPRPAPSRGTSPKPSSWRGTSRPAAPDTARGTPPRRPGPETPTSPSRGTPGPAGPPGRRR